MPSSEIGLEKKVAFLSERDAYDDGTTAVAARETHMSWLFLTDRHAYKLKKPVRYSFLDFSTLARRRFYCEEELRLNRRLAPQTYLRTIALRRDRSGRLHLGEDARHGRVIDWLVKMQRLPEKEMLESCILDGRVKRETVLAVGTRLAEFYAACRPEIDDGELYLRHLAGEQAINRSTLTHPDFGMVDLVSEPLDLVDHALVDLTPSIRERIRQGRIVEGHGDLRPEHICLIDPLQIIDCLEFNRAMRIIDPFDEITYLGLECEILGAGWIRRLLMDVVSQRLGSQPDPRLLAFYGAFRALLRARLCMAHLFERPVRHPDKWKPLALRYIRASERECRSLRLSLPSPAGATAALPLRDA